MEDRSLKDAAREGCRILQNDITTILMNIFSSIVPRSNGDDLWNWLKIGWWRAHCEPKKKNEKKWKNGKNGERSVNGQSLSSSFSSSFHSFFMWYHVYERIGVTRLSASQVHTRVSWIAPRRQWPNDWMLRQGQRSKQKAATPLCRARSRWFLCGTAEGLRPREMVTTEKKITAEMNIFMFNGYFRQ